MKINPFRLLCITGLFAIFSSTISKSPVLPFFASHLGAAPSGVGVIAAVSALTGIIVSIPAGMFSDRFGRKKMLIFAAIIFATAPFLYLLVTQLWQLAVIRFYHGFATAVFMPVAMALVSDLFHKERGEKLGWFSTSTLAGRFLAPLAGGSIIGAIVFNPGLSYRLVYLVCGAAGLIVLVLAFRIKESFSLSGERSGPSSSRPLKGGAKRGWKETLDGFRDILSSRRILITSIVEAAILFAYGTFETFLPLYALQSGLSAYKIGIFLSIQVITLALTKPLMGRFSDRHGRKPQILAGALTGAFCIGSFGLFRSFIPLLALSILFGLSLSVVTAATSAFIADLSRKETHGSAMGVLGSIMDIGHTTGPLVSGIIAGYFGFEKAFIFSSALLGAIAVLFFIGVMRDRQS
ncbi:MAG: MFS transporter [Nitrospiraceae bacterium]|nr:MAG: MFS transporter [Nitrospiraceae bacterium]